MVDIGVNTILKYMRDAKGTIEFDHFHVFGMRMAIYVLAFTNRFEYRSR